MERERRGMWAGGELSFSIKIVGLYVGEFVVLLRNNVKNKRGNQGNSESIGNWEDNFRLGEYAALGSGRWIWGGEAGTKQGGRMGVEWGYAQRERDFGCDVFGDAVEGVVVGGGFGSDTEIAGGGGGFEGG